MAAMKNPIPKVATGTLMTCMIWLMGCGKPTDQVDRNWTPPVTVASSIAGLGGAARLHNFQDTLIGLQVLHGGSANLYLWNRENGSWSTTNIPGLPNDDGWLGLWGAAGIDPQTGRIVLPGGYAENERLMMKAVLGRLTESGSLRDTSEKTWLTDKRALLGDTPPNVTLNSPFGPSRGHNRSGAILGRAVLNGSETIIPFTFDAVTFTPPNTLSNSPFCRGVFRSRDSGRTWQFEKVSGQLGRVPALCQTTGYLYYFAGPYPLWFSRKAANEETWQSPKPITKTSHGFDAIYGVAGYGDTAHICWMDWRHNKSRFRFDAPPVVNSDIYYRRRGDSAAEWDKEVWLSKGLMYCYAPTIAAEADKVVVVWAGIRKAGKWHTDMGPNDIYYVTSKDGGKTWTSAQRVTDGAKDGITAGMPQVALLNGTIHLLYIQGAQQSPKELSPGLTKLGQGPWPIYHTQRPFPK